MCLVENFHSWIEGLKAKPLEEKETQLAVVVPTADEKAIVQRAIMNWSQELNANIVRTHPKNSVCFSPLSIMIVLGMILRGLPEGAAKQQIIEKICLNDLSESHIQAALGEICRELCADDHLKISISNALAVAPEVKVKDSFKEAMKTLYDSEIFQPGPHAVEEINQWVSQHTQGMIPKILSSEIDLSDLMTCLINAIYFKGEWKEPFKKENSFKQEFTCIDGSKAEKLMLHQFQRHLFLKKDDFKMLEKSFLSNDPTKSLSFVVFLPKDPNGLPELEKRLDANFVSGCRAVACKEKVSLTLPKMEINFKLEDLKEHLENMGLPVGEEIVNLADRAQVTNIIHQSKLRIDEKGAEGAAATVAVVREMMMCPTILEPEEFDARHPFAFFVMAGDEVLFQGSIKDASALLDQ